MADEAVGERSGGFERLLGGEQDKRFLEIRIFDKKPSSVVYQKQTQDAQKNHVSNRPCCASDGGANKTKIWEENQMEAGHVTAWSKGGGTDIKNCQMLCQFHNRLKGNKC